MRRVRLVLLVTTLIIPAVGRSQTAPAAPTARPKPAQLAADSLELAHKLTTWLYTSQVDSLVAHMDSASRADPHTSAMIEQWVAQLAMNAGSEQQLLEERWVTRNGLRQYWRKAKFSNLEEPFLVRWVIVAPRTIGGLGLGFANQAPPIDP
jgi:hypothetical protein